MTARKIKIFVSPKFQWGVFKTSECISLLGDGGVSILQRPFFAEIIVVPTKREAIKFQQIFPFKRFLLYADDPRLDRQESNLLYRPSPLNSVHIMNVFTGDVFIDNYAFCNTHQIGNFPCLNPVSEDHFLSRERQIATMMSYSTSMLAAPSPPHGTNLHKLRVDIISYAHRNDFGKVMGGGWPQEFFAVESGYAAEVRGEIQESWSIVKLRWLSRFWFNLCFENTLAPHYVTEKIWHAIMAGCVPVYYGRGSTISTSFPKGSFVDYTDFNSPKKLVQYLLELSATQACEIYNAGVAAFNKMLKRKANSHALVELDRARRVRDKLFTIGSNGLS